MEIQESNEEKIKEIKEVIAEVIKEGIDKPEEPIESVEELDGYVEFTSASE